MAILVLALLAVRRVIGEAADRAQLLNAPNDRILLLEAALGGLFERLVARTRTAQRMCRARQVPKAVEQGVLAALKQRPSVAVQ